MAKNKKKNKKKDSRKELEKARILNVQLDRFKTHRELTGLDAEWKRYKRIYDGGRGSVSQARRRVGSGARASTNLSFSQIETIKAILTQNTPIITYGAPVKTEAWIDIAKLMTELVARIFKRNNMKFQNTQMIHNSLLYGISWLKPIWDEELFGGHGDIGIGVPDTRDMYLEPGKGPNARKCNLLFETTTTDGLTLIREHPKRRDDVLNLIKKNSGKTRGAPLAFLKEREKGFTATAAGAATSTNTAGFFEIMGTIGEHVKQDIELVEAWFHDDQTIEDIIEVFDIRTGVTRKEPGERSLFPDGRLMQFAGQVIFEDRENKFPGFPYVEYLNYVAQDQYGVAEMKHIENLQKQHDIRNRQLFNIMGNKVANLIILGARASADPDMFTNAPNNIVNIQGDPDGIRVIDAPNIGTAEFNSMDTIERWIEIVTGVPAVSKGLVPAEVRSGAAIEQLQEAADTRLKGKSGEMERTYGNLGGVLAQMIPRHYIENVHYHIPKGLEKTKEWKQWKNGNIHKDFFEIEVEAGVNRPRSKIAQKQEQQWMFDREILDEEYMAKHTQLEDIDEVIERMTPIWEAKREAKLKELEAAAAEQPPQQGGGTDIGNAL